MNDHVGSVIAMVTAIQSKLFLLLLRYDTFTFMCVLKLQ